MPTHPMVPQDMMPMHMNMSPGMTQPHHMMASGMPHMGMPPNPMHHEHIPPSAMYNNSESAYHHHMQSMGCPPQHVPQQPQPPQLQQLPVQQPILPCTSESPIVSNSVTYSDSLMPPVHVEQPIQMPPEQQQPLPQPQQQQQPPPQLQEQEQLQQTQPPPLMPESPVESEIPVQADSPEMEQIDHSPPPQPEVQSPLAQNEVKQDSTPEIQSPIKSPNAETSINVENDNTSVASHQSRSLSPAELKEPQSLERDCWSESEQDHPPPTLTAEISPPASPKVENETVAESSIFNFTEDEEPPPPLHSLTDGSPRKLKGLTRYLNFYIYFET